MSLTAFLFPGQGSQIVGMGKDLAEKYPLAREIYSAADNIMSLKLSEICFNGPSEILKQTYLTQPALFVHSYIITKLIEKELKADVTAGHSLGEYTSNVYAGSVTFEDCLELVKKRGELMFDAGEAQKGTMAAIIDLTAEQVMTICSKASSDGIVQPANFNSPGQIVISGEYNAVHKAMKIAKDEFNCRIAKELEVSGAFHSDLMLGPAETLWMDLEKTEFRDAQIPVYLNLTSYPETDGLRLKNALYRQLISSVKWEDTIRNMINDGVTKFYEIGAGKVLSGLINKINSTVEVFNISNADDIVKFSKDSN
jgi:[acyl-carrier-protein] S-malonyltransferase